MYRSEVGNHIPYVKFGFKTLDDFLRSIPDVVSSYSIGNILFVKAVPLQASCHINSLVQGQRKAKKSKSAKKNWAGRFKSFRVASSIAPNRNFNRNYNNTHYISRLPDSLRGQNLSYATKVPFRPPASFDVRSHLVPQVMLPKESSQTVDQSTGNSSTQPVPGPLFFNGRPSSTTNDMKPFDNVNSSTVSDSNSMMKLQDDRANLRPQLKQSHLAPQQDCQVSLVNQPNTKMRFQHSHDDRADLKPQIMQPQTVFLVNQTQTKVGFQDSHDDRADLQIQAMHGRPAQSQDRQMSPKKVPQVSQEFYDVRAHLKPQMMQPERLEERRVSSGYPSPTNKSLREFHDERADLKVQSMPPRPATHVNQGNPMNAVRFQFQDDRVQMKPQSMQPRLPITPPSSVNSLQSNQSVYPSQPHHQMATPPSSPFDVNMMANLSISQWNPNEMKSKQQQQIESIAEQLTLSNSSQNKYSMPPPPLFQRERPTTLSNDSNVFEMNPAGSTQEGRDSLAQHIKRTSQVVSRSVPDQHQPMVISHWQPVQIEKTSPPADHSVRPRVIHQDSQLDESIVTGPQFNRRFRPPDLEIAPDLRSTLPMNKAPRAPFKFRAVPAVAQVQPDHTFIRSSSMQSTPIFSENVQVNRQFLTTPLSPKTG